MIVFVDGRRVVICDVCKGGSVPFTSMLAITHVCLEAKGWWIDLEADPPEHYCPGCLENMRFDLVSNIPAVGAMCQLAEVTST